jgi:hypothetical protein
VLTHKESLALWERWLAGEVHVGHVWTDADGDEWTLADVIGEGFSVEFVLRKTVVLDVIEVSFTAA